MPQPFHIDHGASLGFLCVCVWGGGVLCDKMGKLPTHTCDLHVLGSVPLLTYNPS